MQQQPEPVNSAQPGHRLTLLASRRPRYAWYHKLAAIAAAMFCFELGVFLLVYPWMSQWSSNAGFIPWWGRELWTSPWVRGAVSGIGLLNIWISFIEVFRFRRFSA